ncbi:type IV secretion protein Rhs [Serratia marcescens]|uniref:Type VI secretion system tip protein VgrG n=1 Tax=Serratia montpellierensis TaxID=2598730 RepID=A0ABS8JAB9_9GAMM|nr:type VI secretion system tip protein VgrG [Serratia sp. Pon4B]MBI6123157.1 type VI secretion system tip protein VgrG [Serratia marcescens]MCC7660968.1 type VI secretion system tip protein VgrG [Serratia sp. Pon4B]BEO81442.1 type IV secretion protein Rhs [Serratia marcescens]HEJ7933152.1 type VI secretion system tip protein VgrG [Serratia marcescens]
MPLIEIDNPVLAELNAFPLSFTTQEGLSSNSQYSLEFECEQADVDYESLLGEGVRIQIERPDFGSRPFYAYVIGASDAGQHQDKFVYKLELSTWLWFLMQNRNSRIFQDLNVLDIIEQIFSRYGFADYRLDIQGTYPTREYCVQFSETDFAFISRLLEDEGIWYYFDHAEDKHTLVITDRQDFDDLDFGYAVLPFMPDSEENRAIREGIQRIQRSRKVRPNEIVLRDFDFQNPRKNLQTKVEESRLGLQNTPLEWYDYAAGYVDTERGENLARLRLEEMQSDGHLLFGESNAVGLMAGKDFSLILHPDANRNRRFKLTRCDYVFVQDGPDSSSDGRNVTCRFNALNDDVAFRPLRETPKPQMPGIQSATVVGAPNSEVHTDKFARIRVHFHWDRYKTTEEDSSCWIRVVQAWAGKGWGVIAMPRVGQEVLVTYVDGDLDRPMVTGIVYNGDNPPPYQLPEYINYSGMVSRSLRFGKPQHASQLTFDDNRNNERVMLHAERDLQTTVERNQATEVGMDKFDIIRRTFTDWFTNHVSYKDYVFSITGFDASIKGVSASMTGVSLTATGVSTSFTGVSTSFTGVSTSFTGVSTSFTGLSTSFTGQSTSCTGVSNSMTGESNSFTSISNSMTGESNSYTTVSTSQTGSSTSFTGVSVSTTGSSTSTTGCSISTTGSSTSTTGCSISTTGSSVSTTGSSVGTTGSSVSSTGSSVSNTGSSVSNTGSSTSTTGVSISYTGASLSETGVDLKKVGMQSKN